MGMGSVGRSSTGQTQYLVKQQFLAAEVTEDLCEDLCLNNRTSRLKYLSVYL